MDGMVKFRIGGSALVEEFFLPIRQLYDEVFSEPPFYWAVDEPERHCQRLIRLGAIGGLGAVVGLVGSELIAFVYGRPLSVDTKWWDSEYLEPLPEDMKREYESRTFAVVDLAVHRSWRRRGVGRRLLQTLLASRTEERAVLSVQSTATETHAFYESLGWCKVGRAPGLPTAPFFDDYWLPLRREKVGGLET